MPAASWDSIAAVAARPVAFLTGSETHPHLALTDGVIPLDSPRTTYVVRHETHSAARAPDGSFYLGVGSRVLRALPDGSDPVDVTAQFGVAAESARVMSLRDGEIWVAGASRRLQVDGTFAPVPAAPLEMSSPLPVEIDLHGNRWGLAATAAGEQVMVCPANEPQAWQYAGLPAGRWTHVLADRFGFVWVAGEDGWRRLRPVAWEEGWDIVGVDVPPATCLALSPRGTVLAGTADGGVLELQTEASGALRTQELGSLSAPVRAVFSADDGSVWAATENQVHRLDAAEDAWQRTWRQMPGHMPGGGNHDVFAAQVQDRVYVAGGWPGAWGLPTTRHVCDELFALDPRSGYWRVASRMHIPRRYNGIAALEDRVWVIGGETRTAGREGEGQALYLVDIYDPTSDTWAAGPALNDVRTDPFVVTCGDRIYAIGGAAHNSGPKLDTVESIGPGETAWRFEAPLPEPTRQGHGCALDGVVYCCSDDGVFAFDTSTGRWIEDLPQPPGPLSNGILAAAFQGEMWLMGGFDYDAVWCYNPQTRTWRSGPDLPTPQSWGAAIVVDDELFVICGAHGATPHEGVIYDDRTFVLRNKGEN